MRIVAPWYSPVLPNGVVDEKCTMKGTGLQRVQLPPGRSAWLSVSRRETRHLGLNPKPAFGFASAANAILLPETKPRAMRKHFVVSSIRSREVARAQRSGASGTAKMRSSLSISAMIFSSFMNPPVQLTSLQRSSATRASNSGAVIPRNHAIPKLAVAAMLGGVQFAAHLGFSLERMQTLARPLVQPNILRKPHFYFSIALLVAVGGFWPSFFSKLAITDKAHLIHGITATLWMTVPIIQSG
jgi:hypothetical protein